jgi:hypothetical protein
LCSHVSRPSWPRSRRRGPSTPPNPMEAYRPRASE